MYTNIAHNVPKIIRISASKPCLSRLERMQRYPAHRGSVWSRCMYVCMLAMLMHRPDTCPGPGLVYMRRFRLFLTHRRGSEKKLGI